MTLFSTPAGFFFFLKKGLITSTLLRMKLFTPPQQSSPSLSLNKYLGKELQNKDKSKRRLPFVMSSWHREAAVGWVPVPETVPGPSYLQSKIGSGLKA